MASTANLRSRRSAAQLHALAGVEREIRAQDSNGRRKYLREFNKSFRTYESVLTNEEVQSTLGSADLVLIGDYHALSSSQRCAASLVEQRAMAGDRPVVLGESHMAPGHLPRAIRKQNPEAKVVTVLQNVDSLYWWAAGERAAKIEAV